MSAMVISGLISILAVLVGAVGEKVDLRLPAFVIFLLHEIGEAGKFGLALLVAVNVIREVLAHQMTQAGESLGELKSTIETTLGRTSTSVDEGLTRLNATVAATLSQMKLDVHLERSWSPQEVDETLRHKLPKQRSAAGLDKDTLAVEKEIATALLSGDIEQWRRAEELLKQVRNPEYYLRLAYKFWSVNRLDEGLKLAETGLGIAGNGADSTITSQLKNNLAYFYAEANRVDKKDQAFQYIREAREDWPLNEDFLETEGCVKIAFGTTKEEAREGVKICARVAFTKGDDRTLNKWMERYEARTF
jgi:hypothetical protein